MKKFQLLALLLILSLLTVIPQKQGAAIRHHRNPSTYIPGEVIVKIKGNVADFAPPNSRESLMSIARSIGEEGGGEIKNGIEPLVRSATRGRVGEIISQRGLDRLF